MQNAGLLLRVWRTLLKSKDRSANKRHEIIQWDHL
jgi:hypothetical protein